MLFWFRIIHLKNCLMDLLRSYKKWSLKRRFLIRTVQLGARSNKTMLNKLQNRLTTQKRHLKYNLNNLIERKSRKNQKSIRYHNKDNPKKSKHLLYLKQKWLKLEALKAWSLKSKLKRRKVVISNLICPHWLLTPKSVTTQIWC